MIAAADLKVADVMTPHPHTVSEKDRLSAVVELFERHRIKHIPVVRDGHLVGIVSERNLRDALPSIHTLNDPASRKRAFDATRVEQVMVKDPITVSPESGLIEAIGRMRRFRGGSLPVVSHHELVGILTAGDLLTVLERLILGSDPRRLSARVAAGVG